MPIRFKPDPAEVQDRTNTKDLLDMPEGIHLCKIANFSEDVETARWEGDIVEFVTDDGTSKIADFIDSEKIWKFGRLAKAIGDDARAKYKEVDSEGYSMFRPGDYIGRFVQIEVETGSNGRTQIKRLTWADPEGWEPRGDTGQADQELPKKPKDDIPF